MRSVIFFIFLTAMLAVSSSQGSFEKTDNAECNVWNTVIMALKSLYFLSPSLSCHHNDLCTGFECDGLFISPTDRSVESNVVFGFEFFPCNTTQKQLKFHVTANQSSISENTILTNMLTQTHIPVPIFPAADPNKQPMRITLVLVHQLLNDTLFSLAMNATVSVGDQVLMLALVPTVSVRLPQCVVKTVSDEETLTGIACIENLVHQCGNNQRCVKNPVVNPIQQCACIHGLVWQSDSKQCELTIPTRSSASFPTLLVAASSTVLGVFLVAVVIAMVVKYRRHQQRYGQHELLISDQDGEGGGDTPMLQA